MAHELLRYQPAEGGREGWLAQITELVVIAKEDPALGVAQGAGALDLATGPHALGAENSKFALAKRAASHAASSPRGEPSYQIVQRAPEDAHVSLERRQENHDRAIDDIGKAGKKVKVPDKLFYNPGCLTLARQQRYLVWPDKFRPDIGACYDRSSNPVEFL
jgi:hypothetical protein